VVPDAILLLKAPSYRDEGVRTRFAQRFAEHGIASERLQFRGPSGLDAMMQEYGDIDVALDPVPYNGGTTTLQALWMGVPVITLAGGNFVSRMGASFLTTLGHPEWVASDEDAYVATAARLATDPSALRHGRGDLRAQMLEPPLCEIDAYVKHLEALLRLMWVTYCEGGAQRVISSHTAPEKATMAHHQARKR